MLVKAILYNNCLANVKIHLIVQNEQKNQMLLVKKFTKVKIDQCG
ncbi:hypothetical protein FDUTEX481_07295 [Tolypothrix sp. PCC 7601]|nr:hypothetical protein FDUTEX481_07295 [Tolypothrix sp. PCC 7601]